MFFYGLGASRSVSCLSVYSAALWQKHSLLRKVQEMEVKGLKIVTKMR